MSVAPQGGKDPPEGSRPSHFWEGALRSREMYFRLLLEPPTQTCAPPLPPGPAPSGSASPPIPPLNPQGSGGLKPPRVSGSAWEPVLAKSKSLVTQP